MGVQCFKYDTGRKCGDMEVIKCQSVELSLLRQTKGCGQAPTALAFDFMGTNHLLLHRIQGIPRKHPPTDDWRLYSESKISHIKEPFIPSTDSESHFKPLILYTTAFSVNDSYIFKTFAEDCVCAICSPRCTDRCVWTLLWVFTGAASGLASQTPKCVLFSRTASC